jgi:hypothetical protein
MMLSIFSPASSVTVTSCRDSAVPFSLLRGRRNRDSIIYWIAEFVRQIEIQRARVTTHARCDLRGQQRGDDPVLVSGPHRGTPAQKSRTATLLAAKPKTAVKQSRGEPFESDRHFVQTAAKLGGHQITGVAECTPLFARRIFAPPADGEIIPARVATPRTGHYHVKAPVESNCRSENDGGAVWLGILFATNGPVSDTARYRAMSEAPLGRAGKSDARSVEAQRLPYSAFLTGLYATALNAPWRWHGQPASMVPSATLIAAPICWHFARPQ